MAETTLENAECVITFDRDEYVFVLDLGNLPLRKMVNVAGLRQPRLRYAHNDWEVNAHIACRGLEKRLSPAAHKVDIAPNFKLLVYAPNDLDCHRTLEKLKELFGEAQITTAYEVDQLPYSPYA